jgi:hypothetical protein
LAGVKEILPDCLLSWKQVAANYQERPGGKEMRDVEIFGTIGSI